MFKNKKINHKLLIKIELLILAVCFVVGVFQFVDLPPSIKEAIALATTHKPETFTELYFENHIDLPKTINRWQQYSFTFTIHNLEYKDMDYRYVVYLERDNEKTTLSLTNNNLGENVFKKIR